MSAAGVRRVVTPRSAPVVASLVVTGDAGVLDSDVRFASYAGTATRTDVAESARAWTAGLSGGIAVDRELTDGLWLRVSTPLVGVDGWRSRVTCSQATGARAETHLSLDVLVAPRLELRVAF